LMLFLHLGVRTLFFIPLIVVASLAAAYVSPWFFAITIALIIGLGFWYARGALVIGLAIPTSIIGTFLVLGMLGRSLNVISLAGLAFAVGMLVDNAIVVLENIYRRHALGEPPFTAAVRGTQEVWGAVVASTLTTLAVFVPVVFVQEEAGQLFRDIALAISAAVGLSLVVSMTVIPTATARLFGRKENEGEDGLALHMPATVRGPFSFGRARSHEGNGDEPPEPPPEAIRSVSPWMVRTAPGSMPSASAAICAYAVARPVPIDCVPECSVTAPAPSIDTRTASTSRALPVTSM